MKKIALILVAAISFIACDKHEHITFDGGQTGISFTKKEVGVTVPTTGTFTATVDVDITTISSSDRTFDVTVDLDESTLPTTNYTVGVITIPANSYHGTLEVTGDDTGLADLTYYTLKVDMVVPNGVAVTTTDGDSVTFNVIKQVVCNDYQLDIVLDNWGSETSWEITDDLGAVVQSGGPYSDGTPGAIAPINFTLADGCYTFTIYDSYGDGLFDGSNTGSWALTCSVLNQASGEGAFGNSVAQDFCVNQ